MVANENEQHKIIKLTSSRLTLKCLNDLVFIKHNRKLRHLYDARNVIDPICLDNIDEVNEWLIGVSKNHKEVFDGDSNFTWDDVAEASGVEENIMV